MSVIPLREFAEEGAHRHEQHQSNHLFRSTTAVLHPRDKVCSHTRPLAARSPERKLQLLLQPEKRRARGVMTAWMAQLAVRAAAAQGGALVAQRVVDCSGEAGQEPRALRTWEVVPLAPQEVVLTHKVISCGVATTLSRLLSDCTIGFGQLV